MIEREGEGWRLAWDPDRRPYGVLIGGADWATELHDEEADALRLALIDLVAQHAALVDQLMEEEAIGLELDRPPWWLSIEGDRQSWDLRVILTAAAGRRCFEGRWPHPASRAVVTALQQLNGQP